MPRAGVAQFTGSKNWEENVEAVRRLAARAAEAGVNLLGFHELASTIYMPFAEDPELFDLAQPDTGPSVTAVREIARQHEMVVVFPYFEQDGQYYYNSAVVVGPRGDILTKYRKTSVPTSRLLPATNERHFFRPGNLGFPVVDTPFGGTRRHDHLLRPQSARTGPMCRNERNRLPVRSGYHHYPRKAVVGIVAAGPGG